MDDIVCPLNSLFERLGVQQVRLNELKLIKQIPKAIDERVDFTLIVLVSHSPFDFEIAILKEELAHQRA